MTTYHFVAASETFLTVEEPLEESMKERRRHYAETTREIDSWFVIRSSFLHTSELAELASQVPQPSAAVVSTDESFITFLKLRLEYVAVGRFEAPSPSIPDPLSGSV